MVPVTSDLRGAGYCITSSHVAAMDDEIHLCRVPGIVWVELEMVKMKKTAGAEMAVSTPAPSNEDTRCANLR
jgi:hypothetical protein